MDVSPVLSSVPAAAPSKVRLRFSRPIRLGLALAPLFALLALTTGCGLIFTRHRVAKLPQLPMKTATLAQLVALLNHNANSIRTLNAKVLLMATTGGPRTGTVTKYHDIVAYLLVRKPSGIRLIGQFSIFGTLFDMASDGDRFELSLPARGEFFVGRNDVIPPVIQNPLERLRPQVILQALLINPIEPDEKVAAMNDKAETGAEYTVLVLRSDSDGVEHLVRKIIFSRYDLLPRREVVYQPDGSVATVADYGEFISVQGVPFPSQVVIQRPREEYSIRLVMQKVRLNLPLKSDEFQLQQPAGSKLIRISADSASPPATASGQLR